MAEESNIWYALCHGAMRIGRDRPGLRDAGRGSLPRPMPVVSVIVPTCDRPELVGRALQSALAQTRTDLEVVLVDNNRRTTPVRQNPRLARMLEDPRVVLVSGGLASNAAAARNAGLAVAHGEWITYLDDDDEYHPEKIAAQFDLAQATGAPLVLCGYTVVLPCRQRMRQVDAAEFRGDELLLSVSWNTSLLFHRRDSLVRFDENLTAGEDTFFAQTIVLNHGMKSVPNCARSLVNIYPQLDAPRVHRDGEAIWRSFEATAAMVGIRYSPAAVQGYLAMGRLFRAQFGHGNFAHFMGCAWAALRARGPGAWRLVVNATARLTGLFKRWVVS